MAYDSTEDTHKHISNVRHLIVDVIQLLRERAYRHDASKLESPEKEVFDKFTPKLRDSTYGSEKYQKFLQEMGVALEHHYENNPHHPEHYDSGVDGMTLIDIVEMFCDWKAASLRHADGDFSKSLKINHQRFNLSDQLYKIFENTRKQLGW